MDITDGMFDEFVDNHEEFDQLLVLLNERVPQGCFQLLSDNGKNSFIGDELSLPREVRDRIVIDTKKGNRFVDVELPQPVDLPAEGLLQFGDGDFPAADFRDRVADLAEDIAIAEAPHDEARREQEREHFNDERRRRFSKRLEHFQSICAACSNQPFRRRAHDRSGPGPPQPANAA